MKRFILSLSATSAYRGYVKMLTTTLEFNVLPSATRTVHFF
jgi:hypothetical protein